MLTMTTLPLRENVCIFLLSPSGRVLVARDRNSDPFWRLPQGGLEEEKEEFAVIRELSEELGLKESSVHPLQKLRATVEYEFQTQHPGVSDKYRGQRQQYWVALFLGNDEEILAPGVALSTEFNEWRWAELSELEYITEPKRFKRYIAAIGEIVAENLTARVGSYTRSAGNG
jgi:8-oxo-dGTP pyrophosphatase MutT (NUDIX family)